MMKPITKKRILCLVMTAMLALAMTGCKDKKKVTYDPLPEDDGTLYSVTVCQDADNEYNNAITQGFYDALMDLFGEKHISVTPFTVSKENSADVLIQNSIRQETDLIFANGGQSLAAAAAATDTIPVVGAGVMDFQSTLHLAVSPGSNWNKKTGTNVTGVSSLPDMDAQLSLLIESTPQLQSVGILYDVTDAASLYQIRFFEKYLDQAGIPWKEYQIPRKESSLSSSSAPEGTSENASVITPSKQIAASITEGTNMNLEDLGGNGLISGIISPDSIHAPLVSTFWTDALSAANTAPLAEDASTDEIVRYACNECSCLYIPAQSSLSDQMTQISDIATETGTITVGGDSSLGQHTLTSLYSDPYDMGYQAGKMVYRILVAGELPGEIKIASSSAEEIKLYNEPIANALERSFPKSFSEITSFLETYEIGSNTKRIVKQETNKE